MEVNVLCTNKNVIIIMGARKAEKQTIKQCLLLLYLQGYSRVYYSTSKNRLLTGQSRQLTPDHSLWKS